jgi:hypothetical protein
MHALVPRNRLYWPAGHAAQLAISPVYPKLHTQPVLPTADSELLGHAMHVPSEVACTAVEYVFTGHKEHAALLTSLLYVPPTHDKQSLRPVPLKPALHGQLVLLSYAMFDPVAIACKSTAISAADDNVCTKKNPARSKFGRSPSGSPFGATSPK